MCGVLRPIRGLQPELDFLELLVRAIDAPPPVGLVDYGRVDPASCGDTATDDFRDSREIRFPRFKNFRCDVG